MLDLNISCTQTHLMYIVYTSTAFRRSVHTNMLAILGTVVVFLAVFGSSQAALSDDYQRSERLDAENATDFMLYWTYNKADSTIAFAAKAKTPNWVGLGFRTKIDNTTTYDVVRGVYDSFRGKSEIFDFHAVGQETPVKDTQQDLMDASVAENNSYTTIKFKRKLDTQDSNDTVIKPGPMTVQWSVGNTGQVESSVKESGHKAITLVPEEGDGNLTSTVQPTATTSPNRAVACQESWLLLALSGLLFMLPLLRH